MYVLPTGELFAPTKINMSSGSITLSGSGHRPYPRRLISSWLIPGLIIPMNTAAEKCLRTSPNVRPMQCPYELFGPDLRFVARRRRIAFPSKSSMASKIRLSPGCAAQMNMSELRNLVRSIGTTTSMPFGCVKHAASTYSLVLVIWSTIRRSG